MTVRTFKIFLTITAKHNLFLIVGRKYRFKRIPDAYGAKTKKQNDGRLETLIRALALAAPKKSNVFFIVLLTLIVVAAGVAEPLLLKFIFDRLAGDVEISGMVKGILVLLGVALLKEVAGAVFNWLTWRTRIRIHHNLWLLNWKLLCRRHYLSL